MSSDRKNLRMAKLAPGLKPQPGGQGDTNPVLLLATAVSYASAGAVSEKQSNAHIPALYLLAGFSIELSLKAFILQKANQPAELFAIGHDLEKAWKRALALGMDLSQSTISPEDFSWLIAASAPHHKAITFRYLPDVQPFIAKAAPPDMIKGAGALCALVAQYVPMPRNDERPPLPKERRPR